MVWCQRLTADPEGPTLISRTASLPALLVQVAFVTHIHEAIYCPRGDMENRIKDCQLDLFGHRASAHAFKTNQTRLILAGFAYVLMTHLRLMALKTTDLAKAAPNTIRQKLLKIGARVIASVRRIKISMPDACPVAEIFFTAWRCLAPP